MSIILSGVSFHYYNQSALFQHINLSIASGSKVSIIGNNGAGKSTLLKLIAGGLDYTAGSISTSSNPYYIPQRVEFGEMSVAQSLGISEKINALHAISDGRVEQVYYDILSDDWDIESRCFSAFDFWGIPNVELSMPINSLSGGEKTKLYLAGMMIHKPAIILLDEPTNHLDYSNRQKLYDFVRNSCSTLVIVSHDVTLLNLVDETYELTSKGIKLYGGNYNFYQEEKKIDDEALEQQINTERTMIRLARKKAQEVSERQQRRSSSGEKSKDQLPRIMQKGAKNKGENTQARLRKKHGDIITRSCEKLDLLKQKQQDLCELKIDFDDSKLHQGKLLISAEKVNYEYRPNHLLWSLPIDVELRSGDRLLLRGDNGTGKTTLIKLLTGELQPIIGVIERNDFSFVYLDQEYSKVDTCLTILELAYKYNTGNLLDHEIKLRLHRALFPKNMWDMNCRGLSGGERMRLYLCCLMISNQIPDLFILDEPTNNLDLSSLKILTNTIKDYRGSLLIVSHDQNFVSEIGITGFIDMKTNIK